MKFKTGKWVWSKEYTSPVRIIEGKSLWAYESYQVWLPRHEQLIWMKGEMLEELDTNKEFSLSGLIYKLAAARIKDTLAQDNLLAPVDGNLIPLPHQIYALNRAISGEQVRYLLADEVGLGKTIEAGLVMRELKLRGLAKRILVVAPKGLVSQWVQEMEQHFNEEFTLLAPQDFSALRRVQGNVNFWEKHDQVICPMDSIKPMEGRRGWSKERVDGYNRERFEDIIQGNWDLIVIDEAHRVAGSSDTVARYKLGRALSDAAPYLLLLTATPHQGKTDGFYRLMTLLDRAAFPNEQALVKEQVAPYVIRTEKREAMDGDGMPLFKPRVTQLMPVGWDVRHREQRLLYEAVTDYVREGYNAALREKKNYIGFLMVLMQRMVTSSTRAIKEALAKRLDALKEGFSFDHYLDVGELWELDGQDLWDELLSKDFPGLKNELEELERLLALARRCEIGNVDAKAENLLDIMHRLQVEENNEELKFLVFTEFKATQQMLAELLREKGFTVALLNGSMDMAERQAAQRDFSERCQVLVSTEAGGEGINLQFCYVVINYDLPWNPMRLEQRIGRVDRIGQKETVQAFNLILKDTVEYRVQEVLQEKLKIILEEFGVDKTGDVLDSGEAEIDFSRVYVEAIMHPDEIEERVENLAGEVREKASHMYTANSIIRDEKKLDAKLLQKLSALPLGFWLEQMVVHYLQDRGGTVDKTLTGYQFRWPDGTEDKDVVFSGEQQTMSNTGKFFGLEEKRVADILKEKHLFVNEEPIPRLHVKGIPAEVKGYWSLWSIRLNSNNRKTERELPLFITDEGKVFQPTARFLWDVLLKGENIRFVGFVEKQEMTDKMFEIAQEYGFHLFKEMESRHYILLEQEEKKGQLAFSLRQEAIARLGLPAVRSFRLKQLAKEEKKWQDDLQASRVLLPDLNPVCLVYVEGV